MTHEIIQKLKSTQSVKILLVGDLMLDEFHWCEAKRLSPEAPVPICKVTSTTYVPGGAGNVATNISVLGESLVFVSTIGTDSTGDRLKGVCEDNNISTKHLIVTDERPTILKSRIITHNQHVARLDRENSSEYSKDLQGKVLDHVKKELPTTHAIVLSDYGKGLLNETVTQDIIAMAKIENIPVIVDPKGYDYSKYKGATCITPNMKEFRAAVKSAVNSETELKEKGLSLISKLGLEELIVTRSEKGMTILNKAGDKTDIATHAKEVVDITGAGDTVIAALAIAKAKGLELKDAANLANLAAGVVVEKVGTATVSLKELETALDHI